MSMFASSTDFAKAKADELIAGEIGRQDRMWGDTNERADIAKGQLFRAGLAQMIATHNRAIGIPGAFEKPPAVFPSDWGGFRDYGSDVANLVVAAAYIRQEIVRRIRNGESTERKSRDVATQPYAPDCRPAVIEP